MRYFGLPHGKDEAWYVLDTQPGACIWLGFRPGVTPERFRALIEVQDTAGMLDCLHRIEIQPGQVYFIPAGIVHALGSDCLVAEIQEPVDLTLRAEYIRPDGSRLPKESMYGAAGMDGMMECFTFDCLSQEELLKKHLSSPQPEADQPWRKKLISLRQTKRFWMDEINLGPDCPTMEEDNPSFQVWLVLEGEGEFQWSEGVLPVKRGDEVFLPYGVPSYRCTTKTTFRALACGVPEQA